MSVTSRLARRVLVVPLVLVCAFSSAFPAAAYEDVGYDPAESASFDPDVRSTLRRVDRIGGGRALLIVVRAYEAFDIYWAVDAVLDARGGPGRDHVLRLYNADLSGSGCYLTRRGGRLIANGSLRQHGRAARCRIPIRYVEPTHRIRWHLVAPEDWGGGSERAPDRGWYD